MKGKWTSLIKGGGIYFYSLHTLILLNSKEGTFTDKKAAHYINVSGVGYINSQKIINGTDRQAFIAGYAQSFEASLRETSSAKEILAP